MAKMTDVARHAGVSIKTVSRVLNNEPHVQDALREKVRLAVRELGYVPSASARSLRSNRTYNIHLICHSLRSNFVAAVQFGALGACRTAGYGLVVSMMDPEATGSRKKLHAWFENLIQGGKPDGIILAPPMANDPMISEVIATFDVPIARIGPNRITDTNVTVTIDDRSAAKEAIQLLIDLGHKRIGFVRGKEDQDATHERYEGYCEALREAGLTVDDALVKPGLFDFETGLVAGDEFLKMDNPPTAVFAANDDMAAGVLVAAHRLGVSVPDELSIIGFDDSEIAEKMWPALTTIRQPLHELGAKAIDLLASVAGRKTRAQQESLVSLPYELVTRQTTGPAPKS